MESSLYKRENSSPTTLTIIPTDNDTIIVKLVFGIIRLLITKVVKLLVGFDTTKHLIEIINLIILEESRFDIEKCLINRISHVRGISCITSSE